MLEITLTWLDGSRKGVVEVFTKNPLRLGRADECEVRFDADEDLKVSAKHAELRARGESALDVEDVGSKNGTFVNGAPAQGATPVPNHAIVQLGKEGPRVKVTYSVNRGASTGISFGAMRKPTVKFDSPKKLASTDETRTYEEAELAPPRRTPRPTLVVVTVLVALAAVAAAYFALRP